jgi:DnaJ-class molecular chaperone
MANPFEKPNFERGPERDPHEATCPQCYGQGRVKDAQGQWVTCPRCGGSGMVLTRK